MKPPQQSQPNTGQTNEGAKRNLDFSISGDEPPRNPTEAHIDGQIKVTTSLYSVTQTNLSIQLHRGLVGHVVSWEGLKRGRPKRAAWCY